MPSKQKISFVKMEGCGNDYIYIDGKTVRLEDKPETVRKLSDRHFGIGGDGVIFINPSERADFEMEMYNADGSRAEMCGNGIRCVAKYVYDFGLTDKTELAIESMGKVKYLQLMLEGGKVSQVRVDMGEPELEAAKIPVILLNEQAADTEKEHVPSGKENVPAAAKNTAASGKEYVIDEPITVLGKTYRMTCVSMGNPHAVVFLEEKNAAAVEALDLEKIGPPFEHHQMFPARINTEFVSVLSKDRVRMRVWERGTGETLACGTGCCAVVTACVLSGLTDREITVQVSGGEIKVFWDPESGHIFMTGPARTAFTGEVWV